MTAKGKAKQGKATAPAKKRGAPTTAAAAGSSAPLGFKVWWDLFGAQGDLDELTTRLDDAGLGFAAPEPLGPEARLRVACAAVKRRSKVEFRVAGREGVWVTFRPVKFEKTNKGKGRGHVDLTVDPSVLAAVSVNRDSAELERENKRCKVGQAVDAEFEALDGQFVALQMRKAIKAVIETGLQGTRIKRAGGLYFVPAKSPEAEQKLRALQAVVQAYGDSDLYCERVEPNSDSSRAAGRATMRTLDGQYAALLDDADDFVAKLEAGELTGGRALRAWTKTARELRARAELYREILDERGDKLQAAADIVATALAEAADAAVDVRGLAKVKGNAPAEELARQMMADIATKAKAALNNAEDVHAPELFEEGDDE
jgi:hypothetical protein